MQCNNTSSSKKRLRNGKISYVNVLSFFSRFTEIFVSELEDIADLKTLVVDYLQGLSPNAAIVDGIVRFVLERVLAVLSILMTGLAFSFLIVSLS